jgi:uncharacterized membrane protein
MQSNLQIKSGVVGGTLFKINFMQQNDFQIKSGVIGGTLFSTAFNISLNDMFFTIIMAAIGAAVSFFVSMFLKRFFGDKKNT